MSSQPLFGGALSVVLPAAIGWLDASDARPVPDHQEVWLERDGAERSIIVELLERAECADEDSGAFHFEEVANGNEALGSSVQGCEPLPADALHPSTRPAPAFVVHGVQQLPRDGHKQGQRLPPGTAAELHVRVAVLRLEAQGTDVLVTVNRQACVGADTAAVSAGDLQQDAELLAAVMASLEIRDWGLFGG